jgi:hypothetical protein
VARRARVSLSKGQRTCQSSGTPSPRLFAQRDRNDPEHRDRDLAGIVLFMRDGDRLSRAGAGKTEPCHGAMPPYSSPAARALEPDAGSDTAPPASARANEFSRELTEFLIDLSVAMHKHAIYPPGHPLLDHAVDALDTSLAPLLVERGALSIGVARRQLIIEGVATDPAHPLLAELAGKLHRHHLGALKLLRGITRAELSDALATVGLEPQRDAEPMGMQRELLQTRWANVKLFPLTYDRLELLDEAPLEGGGGRQGGLRNGHAAQLWMGLARAAIVADQLGEDADMVLEPEAVAHAIDEHDREQAYDQVIVGYLLQIAREVRSDDGTADSSGLQRRVSKLVGSLQPATLKRLLEMGGDASQRRRFVLDASQGMTVGAVVELVQAAASAEGQTISHSLMRMLTKLATHASADQGVRSRAADGALREHVGRLVGSWSLDDPNPLAYSAALEQLAHGDAAPSRDVLPELACEPSRLVAMALELDATGARITYAVSSMLNANALGELLDLLDAAPSPKGSAAEAIWRQVLAQDPLRTSLGESRLDHALVRRLVLRYGTAAVAPLLDALHLTQEGSRRERLSSYLTLLGADAAPEVAEHLGHAPASLARELLICLAKLAPSTPPMEAGPYLGHFDPLLRREAVKLLLAYDETRSETILGALRDADERVVYSGLLAVQSECGEAAAAIIRQRVDAGELTDSGVRVAAIRAAANVRDDSTLEWLLRRTLVTGLLRKTRLAAASPEVLASLTALATHWSDDPRATLALALARESASPSVRGAVRRDGSAPGPEGV